MYAIEVLESKQEEYQNLLDHVDRQLAAGKQVLRSELEIKSAHNSKKHYETRLRDLTSAIECLKKNLT